ncbi:MAG TPA: ComF family protein [Candidatus Binatia bacterium]|nr:ComF family protein [Candidatus Binatia bacterium]
MHRILIDLRTGVVDTLLPLRCHLCREASNARVCPHCESALPWSLRACRACAAPLTSGVVCGDCLQHAPAQHAAWTAFTYEAPVAALLVQLKFAGRLAGARVLGELMARRLAARPEPLPDTLVPVPLHVTRLLGRGYNQALEIARWAGRDLGIPVRAEWARRRRGTLGQTRLSAVERRRNLRGAFAADRNVQGRHVAIVDDVITTGATVGALARALRRAGASRVEAWAVARA